MNDTHIYPENDLEPHDLESRYCRCRPMLVLTGGEVMVVHNSWDGREILEHAFDYADEARN